MVEKKEIVQAILWGSAVLTGLTLLFIGLLVNAVRSSSPDPRGAALRKYRGLAGPAAAAFACGVGSASLCVWWLAASQDSIARKIAVGLFLGQLALLVGAGVSALVVLVWRDRSPA